MNTTPNPSNPSNPSTPEDFYPLYTNPPYPLKYVTRNGDCMPQFHALLKEFGLQMVNDRLTALPHEASREAEAVQVFYEFFNSPTPLLYLLHELNKLGPIERLRFYMTEDSPRPPQLPSEEVLDQLPIYAQSINGTWLGYYGRPHLFVAFSCHSGPGGALAPLTYCYCLPEYDAHTRAP